VPFREGKLNPDLQNCEPTTRQVYQSFSKKRKKDQPKNSSTGLLSKESTV
jgi:hypothetical protein